MGTLGEIINNEPLASAVVESIQMGLDHHSHLSGSTPCDVIRGAISAAIRDIKSHPKGQLFQRFIEYGPLKAGHPITSSSIEPRRELNDAECGSCIEFIHSHMVNRFKGELAELLAIDPCVRLVGDLRSAGQLPENTECYFGDTIQERRQVAGVWAEFAKGADGLIVHVENKEGDLGLGLDGVIEVKSMYLSKRKLDAQIKRHLFRLSGGVKLGPHEWPAETILDQIKTKISVLPANWKLDREFTFEETATGRRMVFPDRPYPNATNQLAEVAPGRWTITLAWSQEALEEAAYEMTFWYMGQVGHFVFANSELPRSWSQMTYDDAGRNAIKMMLYNTMLRPLPDRCAQLAAKLYNVYCFGYPIGIDSREMLWPEDLQ